MKPDEDRISDATRDMLISSIARVGGRLGIAIASRDTREASYAELGQLGLIGQGGCLTRKGAQLAKRLQSQWERNDDHGNR